MDELFFKLHLAPVLCSVFYVPMNLTENDLLVLKKKKTSSKQLYHVVLNISKEKLTQENLENSIGAAFLSSKRYCDEKRVAEEIMKHYKLQNIINDKDEINKDKIKADIEYCFQFGSILDMGKKK